MNSGVWPGPPSKELFLFFWYESLVSHESSQESSINNICTLEPDSNYINVTDVAMRRILMDKGGKRPENRKKFLALLKKRDVTVTSGSEIIFSAGV